MFKKCNMNIYAYLISRSFAFTIIYCYFKKHNCINMYGITWYMLLYNTWEDTRYCVNVTYLNDSAATNTFMRLFHN